MENDINSVEDLQKEVTQEGQKVEEVTLLFFDLSSSCTGYSIATVDFTKKSASFTKAGCLWFDSTWSNQDKYHYIFKAVCEYFYIIDKIDYCVAEAYMINMNKRAGVNVGLEMHGALQVALAEVGLKYKTITSQTWRKQLGIKPIITTGADGKSIRDYKTPTQAYINTLTPLPAQVKSNITKNMRTTPNDLADALSIGAGFLTKIGINKLDFKKIQIQPDVQG